MNFARAGAAALLLAMGVSWAASVHAEESNVCIAAADNGQTLRDKRKLRDARAQFLACANDACPAMVRKQCATWASEVDASMPTVVLGASRGGEQLAAVRVSIDGTPRVERLNGEAVAIDPGEHTFRFEVAGLVPLERNVVVEEGEKFRKIDVTFDPVPQPSTVRPNAAEPMDMAAPPPIVEDAPRTGSTQRALGVVVAGVGVVGVGLGSYFALRAMSLYNDALAHCPTPATCDPTGAAGGEDAHGAARVATGFFIAGGALLAGGAILYFTAPRAVATGARSLRLEPMIGLGGAGMRLGGAW